MQKPSDYRSTRHTVVETIGDCVRSLMPRGTRPRENRDPKWDRCPQLPTEVFGIAATIAERSGCYSFPGIVLSRDATERRKKKERADKAQLDGERWAKKFTWDDHYSPPSSVQRYWATLVSAFRLPLVSQSAVPRGWHRATMALLACADEACAGLGFLSTGYSRLTQFTYDEIQLRHPTHRKGLSKRWQMNSMALGIDSSKACVLPKALTPATGCTLRSLSHHLSLLPGSGEAEGIWLPTQCKAQWKKTNRPTSRNILVIPFPYKIIPNDFQEGVAGNDGKTGYFRINQGWLPNAEKQLSAEDDLLWFVESIVQNASKDAGDIHQIVFPECSLNKDIVRRIGSRLGPKWSSIELITAGTIDRVESSLGDRFENVATTLEIDGSRTIRPIHQRKHHRWRLENSQIRNYGLENELDPKVVWWEEIDVNQREVCFYLNRSNWVQTVLICEDLARVDPVLPVIHSAGPNLVIALLLDGPQLRDRWSAQYATVLADDPGSAVLTLTSLGMAMLSKKHNNLQRRVVGLWKDSSSPATELMLEENSHAIVLKIDADDHEQCTMDRRSDGRNSTRLTLVHQTQVSVGKSPSWLERS